MYRDDRKEHSYQPAWWLPGAHLKTIWGRVLRRTPPIEAKLLTWETPDDDFLELHRIDAPAGAPRLVILHGLEGSPRSHYARAMLAEAARRSWGADLLVFRSCGSRMNRQRRFYHSGETGDLDFVLRRVMDEFPQSQILLAGISLGGNVLLKWLGEQGTSLPSRVRGAVAISVPFDLARSSRHIHRGFSRLYERVFLRTLLRKAADIRVRFPELLGGVDLHSIASLWEFDDRVTAPIHGFASAQDYYTRSSSIRWIDKIRVPTLLLSAIDDPFLPREVLEEVRRIADDNRFLNLEFQDRGGHVGFVGGSSPLKPVYYAEGRACDFLDKCRIWIAEEKATDYR